MMKHGLKSAWLGIGALCLTALPSWGNVPNASNFQNGQNQPTPGALNYVEGSAFLQGRQLNSSSVGASTMDPGQVLHTTNGKAEMLLTPGVFLRVNDNSAVKMISPDLANTQVEILSGEAGVEVDELHPQNNLEIIDNGVTTRLEKTGFYEFLAGASGNNPADQNSAGPAKVLVFSGKAQVETGDGHHEDLGKGREMALVPNAVTKPQKFNTNDAQDSLVSWSKLRSQYMAEQSQQYADAYGWAGYPGWYGNPWGLGWGWAGPWAGWGPGWGWGGPGFWGYPGPIFYGGYYRHFGHGYYGHPGFYGGFHSHPGSVGGFHGGTGFRGGVAGGFHGGRGVRGGR
ncbi:MAG TPA: hypothetical protein VFB43_03120 [Terracidiphilus sp.]|nr:hypothetical protein [Terracidiphilus sp.]